MLNCYVSDPELYVKSDNQGISLSFSPDNLNPQNPLPLSSNLVSIFKDFLKNSESCLGWREESLPNRYLNVTEIKPGVYKIKLNLQKKYRLGLYKIILNNDVSQKEIIIKKGLVVVDSEKDRYYPNEKAKLLFAVVNDEGAPVSGADISLTIETPSGEHYYLSTKDGSIREGRVHKRG